MNGGPFGPPFLYVVFFSFLVFDRDGFLFMVALSMRSSSFCWRPLVTKIRFLSIYQGATNSFAGDLFLSLRLALVHPQIRSCRVGSTLLLPT